MYEELEEDGYVCEFCPSCGKSVMHLSEDRKNIECCFCATSWEIGSERYTEDFLYPSIPLATQPEIIK
jgi:hypothetical protein